MSAEFDRLIADVNINCPGVVPTAVEDALNNVLRDFLQRTSAWQAGFQFNTTANTFTYTIPAPGGAAFKYLLAVLSTKDPEQPLIRGSYNMPVPGKIEFTMVTPPDECWVAFMTLYPIADPGSSSCRALVPGWILEQFFDALEAGTLARLMLQPSKPYTNLQIGAMHAKQFFHLTSVARREVLLNTKFTTRPFQFKLFNVQPWTFPWGANVSSNRQMFT